MSKYTETLSDEAVAGLELALAPDTLAAIAAGKVSQEQYAAISVVDQLILDAPALGKGITLYRTIKDMPEITDGGELTDTGYLFGTTSKPEVADGSVLLAIEIPTGTNILELPGGTYVYHRGRRLELDPSDGEIVTATMVGDTGEDEAEETVKSLRLLTMVDLNAKVEELFNECHGPDDGKFCPGGGGGGGGGGKEEKDAKGKDAKGKDAKGKDAKGKEESKDGKKDDGEQGVRKKDSRKGPLHDDFANPKQAKKKATDRGLSLQEKLYIGGIAAYGVLVIANTVAPLAYPAVAKKLAAHRLRNVPILKTGKGYKILSKKGHDLHLIDETGALSKREAQGMLKVLKRNHDQNPLNIAPARIVVRTSFQSAQKGGSGRATAYVHAGVPGEDARTIFVNSDIYDETAVTHTVWGQRKHFMPSYKRNAADHIITHEYGHLVDNDAFLRRGGGYEGGFLGGSIKAVGPKKALDYEGRKVAAWNRAKDSGDLSGYGWANHHEGYAETYAEWHTTGGKTKNRAAQIYAKEFGWGKVSGPHIAIDSKGTAVVREAGKKAVKKKRGITPAKAGAAGGAAVIVKKVIRNTGSGDRVVRTPEGAKRYGVPIGSEIPADKESELALLSMVHGENG